MLGAGRINAFQMLYQMPEQWQLLFYCHVFVQHLFKTREQPTHRRGTGSGFFGENIRPMMLAKVVQQTETS
ncbi:hypothetical protein D3C81_1583250 [compost metagenome]